ncbi:MAG: hypothetical protein ABJA94_05720 [Rhodoglobus sp.]
MTPSEPLHRADGDVAGEPLIRRPRRVQTEPPAGSDPSPVGEAPRHTPAENDEQLKRDKPPHWG